MNAPKVTSTLLMIPLLLTSVLSEAAHQLAFSKRMGVRVQAEGTPEWCREELQLVIDADKVNFFHSSDLYKLIATIGAKVLPNECQQAEHAELDGRYKGVSIWRGTTSKQTGWSVQESKESEAVVPPASTGADRIDPVAGVTAPASTASPATVQTAPIQASEEYTASGQDPGIQGPAVSATFAIDGWIPNPILRQKEGELPRVLNKDKSCGIHHSVKEKNLGLAYLQSQVPCVDGWIHGQGEAIIKRVDGRQLAQVKGNFTRGLFTGKEVIDPNSIVGIRGDKKSMIALLKADTDLKLYYVGSITQPRSNQWSLCQNPQIRVVTEDENLFLSEEMIDLMVDQSAALLSERCPKQRTLYFSAGASPWDFNKKDHKVSHYAAQSHQDRRTKKWNFKKSRAWNGVVARRMAKAEQEKRDQKRREREAQIARQQAEREAKIAQQKAEQARQKAQRQARAQAYQVQQAQLQKWRKAKYDYDRLKNLNGVNLLAYQAEVSHKSFPLDLYAKHIRTEEPVTGAILVRVSDLDNGQAEVDWPISMQLEDRNNAIDDEGVYFVLGRVTGGEPTAEGIPLVKMDVDRAWLCKERNCSDHGDVLALVRKRHGYPAFDPRQQPEQPKW